MWSVGHIAGRDDFFEFSILRRERCNLTIAISPFGADMIDESVGRLTNRPAFFDGVKDEITRGIGKLFAELADRRWLLVDSLTL